MKVPAETAPAIAIHGCRSQASQSSKQAHDERMRPISRAGVSIWITFDKPTYED